MPLTHRRFTVDEFHRMGEAGIFDEDDRVELLDGEIVEMSPVGPPHAACVIRLTDLLTRPGAGERPLVSVQNPLIVADRSEPLPDIVVLRRGADISGASPLDKADVLLLIEVADTSVTRDRAVKLPLYARAGIPEYWLVNLSADRIETWRDPEAGQYLTTRVVARGETVSPARLPSLILTAAAILG